MEHTNKFKISASKIHGQGVIATQFINRGQQIGLVITIQNNKPVITRNLGVYVNHSYKANSCLVKNGNNYDLVAITNINIGEEIVADYNFTPPFLEKPRADFV